MNAMQIQWIRDGQVAFQRADPGRLRMFLRLKRNTSLTMWHVWWPRTRIAQGHSLHSTPSQS